MSKIGPAELGERLQDVDTPVVVDIRRKAEYTDWHIPGSENVDVYEELQAENGAAAEQLAQLPEDEQIVTVCQAGVIAAEATEVLREKGYDAYTLVDGMNGWSRLHRSAPVDIDIDGTLVQVARPGKGCLSHVLVSDGQAAVFDPSHYIDEYDVVRMNYDADLVGVFDSHAHADHVSGGQAFADRHDVPYYLHPADAGSIDATPLEDEQTITIGDVDVTVIHTPGHSQGSVTFSIDDAALLTGDTLFHESVGRVELGVEAGIEDTDVESNAATLYDSLERLRDLPGDPLVLPAHDPGSPEPPVTARMSAVEQQNTDLQRTRSDFIEALANDIPEHPPNFQRVKRVNVGDETVADDERPTLELGPNRCAAE